MTNGSCHSTWESNTHTWVKPFASARLASSTTRPAGGLVCNTTPKSTHPAPSSRAPARSRMSGRRRAPLPSRVPAYQGTMRASTAGFELPSGARSASAVQAVCVRGASAESRCPCLVRGRPGRRASSADAVRPSISSPVCLRPAGVPSCKGTSSSPTADRMVRLEVISASRTNASRALASEAVAGHDDPRDRTGYLQYQRRVVGSVNRRYAQHVVARIGGDRRVEAVGCRGGRTPVGQRTDVVAQAPSEQGDSLVDVPRCSFACRVMRP